MGEPRGALEVETAAGVEREDRTALETLADQTALALEPLRSLRPLRLNFRFRFLHHVSFVRL